MTGSIPGVQLGKYQQVFDTIREHVHAAWLGETENGNLKESLVPYPADQMRMWEISPRVNSAGV